MKWRALGRVFDTDYYAQTPTPLVLEDRVRVYFASRDERGRSFIRYVDLSNFDPTMIIARPTEYMLGAPVPPVLENGKPGAFDSCGQMPSYAQLRRGDVDLYYSGWLAPAGDTPYHNATGLARSLDGGATFRRVHEGPVLDRTPDEPYLAVTPCLAGNRLWYISGLRWETIAGRPEPIYVIRHAELYEGTGWDRDGEDVIPQRHAQECFSRPWVVKVSDREWRMWFCFRNALDYRNGQGAYRIGYATSVDGREWSRHDEVQLERGGWDSTMQCYPAVFESKGNLYMLYNGNTFGKHGFGLAVAE